MDRMLVIAALIIALAPAGLGQTKSARKTETERIVKTIGRLDQERIQAQIHADAAALDRIYADDFIGIGPSGTVRTKPQVLADFSSYVFERFRQADNTITRRACRIGAWAGYLQKLGEAK